MSEATKRVRASERGGEKKRQEEKKKKKWKREIARVNEQEKESASGVFACERENRGIEIKVERKKERNAARQREQQQPAAAASQPAAARKAARKRERKSTLRAMPHSLA